MQTNHPDELYHEELPFRAITVLMVIFAVVSLGSFGLLLYTLLIGPIGSDPAPTWLFLFEFLLMGGLTLLFLNFRALTIAITYDGIRISFGRLGKTMSWSDIESYRQIPRIIMSGGLHIGPSRSGMGIAYTVLGKPAITLKLRSGTIREVTFSTGNPEEILGIIRERTGIYPASER